MAALGNVRQCEDTSITDGVLAKISAAVSSVVVGKGPAIEQLLIALLCRGHVLIEDVPGVGKTLLARALAASIGCRFGRVQFTPDVLPSDITGSSVFNQHRATFEFCEGPIFTEILLADEINRATPRTQSALLEAMEESQVTVDGVTRPLPEPFFVVATQNPIELEGTFPLPEAQLDRFLMRIALGYPSLEEEHMILQRFEATNPFRDLVSVTDGVTICSLQKARDEVEVSTPVRDYLLSIVRATRSDPRVQLGASPRAALGLHRATQARAMLQGRRFAIPDDVKALSVAVLAHRIVVGTQARLRNVGQVEIVTDALSAISVPVEDNVEQ